MRVSRVVSTALGTLCQLQRRCLLGLRRRCGWKFSADTQDSDRPVAAQVPWRCPQPEETRRCRGLLTVHHTEDGAALFTEAAKLNSLLLSFIY